MWLKSLGIIAKMRIFRLFIASSLMCSLSGCFLSYVWTGATLIYDRHNVYKQANDFNLGAEAQRTIYHDKALNCAECVIDVTVFNADLLLSGHVPTYTLRHELDAKMARFSSKAHLFNQVTVGQVPSSTIEDTWITTKIRAQVIADDTINPNFFKVVTTDGIVYLMGEARESQANKVIAVARSTPGVRKVVSLMRVYVFKRR